MSSVSMPSSALFPNNASPELLAKRNEVAAIQRDLNSLEGPIKWAQSQARFNAQGMGLSLTVPFAFAYVNMKEGVRERSPTKTIFGGAAGLIFGAGLGSYCFAKHTARASKYLYAATCMRGEQRTLQAQLANVQADCRALR